MGLVSNVEVVAVHENDQWKLNGNSQTVSFLFTAAIYRQKKSCGEQNKDFACVIAIETFAFLSNFVCLRYKKDNFA